MERGTERHSSGWIDRWTNGWMEEDEWTGSGGFLLCMMSPNDVFLHSVKRGISPGTSSD